MDNWLVAAGEDGVTPMRLSSLVVAAPVLRRRMVVHLSEGAGEIKLVGKAKLIADLLDGQFCGVEQLHRALHPQVIQITQRCVTGHAAERGRVMRAREIYERSQCRHRQGFA